MSLISGKSSSYHLSKKLKKESQWQRLQYIFLFQAVEAFLKTLNHSTAHIYSFAFKKFFELRILDHQMPLKKFALMNLEAKLDQIGPAGSFVHFVAVSFVNLLLPKAYTYS